MCLALYRKIILNHNDTKFHKGLLCVTPCRCAFVVQRKDENSYAAQVCDATNASLELLLLVT